MKRSPRALEAAVAKAVTEARHLTPLDDPAIRTAKVLARKIDDRIHALETRALASTSTSQLFADPCPVCGVTAGPCLGKNTGKPIKTKHAGRNAPTVGALAEEGGGITYDLDVFLRQLDNLGLSPKGRRDLALTTDEEATDDLDEIVKPLRAL